ncbi:MAG: hypothetical protein IJ221_03590 [Oscillibacter sp.]|nr:hypothetical protein [Oscillibacter sp.]
MERSRLKAIMIVILALVNIFLLASLAQERLSVLSARRTAQAQVVRLFEADGITLGTSVISRDTPPSPVQLTRDEGLERSAAALLLDGGWTYSEQGGTHRYQLGGAAVQFRAGGSFSAAGLAGEDGAALCRRFCQSFSLREPESIPESGSVSAGALYQNAAVFNASVTFTFADGVLTEVSGTLLPQNGTAVSLDGELYSALAALTAFQTVRRANQAVASVVEGMELCFSLQSGAGDTMSLEPAWCIITDTVNYYVNCVTGTVTTA